jgi:acylphosphatase
MTAGPENESPVVRRTVYFSGRVQGVGFRFAVQEIAPRFHVTGLVRNLPDGRVELVAEGTQAEVEAFQKAIEQAMRRNIRERTTADGTPTGEFRSFRIAF